MRRMPYNIGETPQMHAQRYPHKDAEEGYGSLRGGHASHDSIHKHGNKKHNSLESKRKREEEQARAWAFIHAVIMAFVSTLFLGLTLFMWFFIYHWSFLFSVLWLVVLYIAAFAITIYGVRKVPRRWILCMGLICFVTIFIGLILGFELYFKSLVYYKKYQEMRMYSNIAASHPVQSFDDGGMFLFTQDSRLDVMRSVGYKSRWTGSTYCVAPVVDSTMSAANDVNFWAVGEECCLARSEFMCGDASLPGTLSALVVLEPEDVVRPFMRWAVQGNYYIRYERAIKLQEAAFADRAARKVKLLWWTQDPLKLQDSFYYDARRTALWFMFGFFFVTLVISYFICWAVRFTRNHDNQPSVKFPKKEEGTKQNSFAEERKATAKAAARGRSPPPRGSPAAPPSQNFYNSMPPSRPR